MPCGDIVRAETQSVLLERREFYFAVTKNVRIRRSSFAVLVEKVLEHAVHILVGEVYRIARYTDLAANAHDVLPVLGGGTTTGSVLLFPVMHK